MHADRSAGPGRSLRSRFGQRCLLTAVAMGPIGLAPAHAAEIVPQGFAVAPEETRNQRLLLQLTLNGLNQGVQEVEAAGDDLTLPPSTVEALHLKAADGGGLRLTAGEGLSYEFDRASSSLVLRVPSAMIAMQRFAPATSESTNPLSPETWGAFVNYDVNLRHAVGGRSAGGSSGTAFGGIADLRVLGPDLVGTAGWAYDSVSQSPGASGLVRLDTTLTWRPTSHNIAVSAGDILTSTDVLSAARPYRFGGLQLGTDFSGSPGWSSAPITTVYGSAQAQSVLDVYLNEQRAYSTTTPGGPFALTLPPGVTAGGANVVLTDVAGRNVIVPVEVPRVDAQLIRQGQFLWSAGAGAPRFGYASTNTSYASDLYGYATARYGAFDRLTLRSEAQLGAGLAQLEAGADAIVRPDLAIRVTAAGSHSARGVGGFARIAASYVGPYGLNFETSAARSFGRFDDVVSVSGRAYAARHRINPVLLLPSDAEMSARLSWQLSHRVAVAASYQANRYPGAGTVGIASLSANWTVGGLPLFVNAFRTLGGRRSTTIIAGVTFELGGAQGGVSLGGGVEQQRDARTSATTWNGSATLSKPLDEDIGSIGWSAYGSRSPSGLFANADAQLRTGYGIPGVALQTFGGVNTGYATMRGSLGLVGGHPFVGDPVQGGLIIVDAERADVPVQLNGFDRGRTWYDGKLALGSAVAGFPQRIAIDTANLSIDAVPAITDAEATVRAGGASLVTFGVQSAASSARVHILYRHEAPPVGSTVVTAGSSAPVSKDGRAYLAVLTKGEIIRVDMPDGSVCHVDTGFDGQGGVSRNLGTLPCE